MSLRDFETTKQLNNESFFYSLMRWRGKASKMPNHPSEKDQVRMMMKNLIKVQNSFSLTHKMNIYRYITKSVKFGSD